MATINKTKLFTINNNPKAPAKFPRVFIGNRSFDIIKTKDPLELYRIYIQNILNKLYGHIQYHNMKSMETVYANLHRLLTTGFLAILEYNNVLYPSNVSIVVTGQNVVLGEPVVYVKKNDTICLYINGDTLEKLLPTDVTYPISYSEEILHSQVNCTPVFSQEDSSTMGTIVIANLQQVLLRLLIYADHAATHYIDEYITGDTDWINHIDYGNKVPGYISTHILFRVQSAISTSPYIPRIVANKSNDVPTFSLDEFYKTSNANNDDILPIATVDPPYTNNLAQNLLNRMY
ncbi:hypothetical protein CcNV_072 [Crangon crangon nudivirus]|uniref:Uncharacterized protein n=1 Tax=Crangon crangon nudivirus TaxID=2880838 RepID=A0AAE9BZ27_9VIRU|nr:hypothetical protein QKT25_gp073 [Crangon crangon nudivirus]UBZ25557.1 hypothetical protein CcNV_072 [Crangon crangon nudivirus]